MPSATFTKTIRTSRGYRPGDYFLDNRRFRWLVVAEIPNARQDGELLNFRCQPVTQFRVEAAPLHYLTGQGDLLRREKRSHDC